ncbi:TetR/AcrR family transcriptional regulator [Streptomyces canus]|uniref:TetR/AcrR family transcriptional regulator n=1 Tax=Streptomyces canus TaxID=58343 RepID=UPI003716FCF2
MGAGKESGRRDARRNRQLIIEAARDLLRVHGLDAVLDEVARQAGVANATLYRHFPTRGDLYEAVFKDAATAFRQVGEECLLIEDGWTALVTYIEKICQSTAADPALHDLLERRYPETSVITDMRHHVDHVLETLLARAQAQGTVRTDVVFTDLILLAFGVQRVVSACTAVGSKAWERHAEITFDGLRVSAATGSLTSAPLPYERLAGTFRRGSV